MELHVTVPCCGCCPPKD